jgi:hypothetical protein
MSTGIINLNTFDGEVRIFLGPPNILPNGANSPIRLARCYRAGAAGQE